MAQYTLKNVSCAQFHTYEHGISAFIKPVQMKNMVGHKSCAEFLTYLRDIIRKLNNFCKIPSFFSSNKYENPEEHTSGCSENQCKKGNLLKTPTTSVLINQ